MGLQGLENGEYVYGVANLHRSNGNAPAWRVRITNDFSSRVVERIQ
jgi:hypothetical protein